MRRTKVFALLTSAVLAFAGCDVIKGPKIVNGGDGGGGNPTTAQQKVLLEDFTGHKCGNCPRAHVTGNQLKDIYGDKLIIMGVHAGFFATTDAVSSGKYFYDFNTPMGTDLNLYYLVENFGYPKGLINRRMFNAKYPQEHTDWGALIDPIFAETPRMQLFIAPTYDSALRELTVDVSTKFLAAGDTADRLVVVLVEDSIINWQKDYDLPSGQQDIQYYVHRHVLRGSINGTWGDPLGTTAGAPGDSISYTFSKLIPSGWNENHVSVVAYVINENGTTYEVIQAEEVKMK